MAQHAIQNFTSLTGNTNTIEALLTMLSSVWKDQGVVVGLIPRATATPSMSVNIQYSSTQNDLNSNIGIAVLNIGGTIYSYQLKETVSVPLAFSPNSQPSARFDLICIEFNTTLKTHRLMVEVGAIGTDPNLASLETSTLKYLPIARVQVPASGGQITNGDIILAGNTNSGDNRAIRSLASPYSNKGVRILTQAVESTATFDKGDVWYNSDTDNFSVYNGALSKIKTVVNLYTLSSSISLGTYSASSTTSGSGTTFAYAPVVRTSPATVFDDILSGATGTGSLIIPANSLKVGDKIVINGIIQWNHGATSTNAGVSNNAQIFVRFGGTAGTWLNNLTYRTNFVAAANGNYSNFLAHTACNTGSTVVGTAFPDLINSIFTLTGIITRIGTTGQIQFLETGDAITLGNNGSWSITSKNSGIGNCQPATINTTISNSIKLDFRVYRLGGGNFIPTCTLTSLSVSLE